MPPDETSPATKPSPDPHRATKAERRAARERVGAYHETEQAKLLERVRSGFGRYDAGEIDAFELDELIHRYHRASQKLWSFCVGTGSQVVRAAGTLEWAEREGELPDWWAIAEPRRRN
ncbi:MAG: hypothetical protein ACRDK9_10610 [Solirubrobacterales bacterium]